MLAMLTHYLLSRWVGWEKQIFPSSLGGGHLVLPAPSPSIVDPEGSVIIVRAVFSKRWPPLKVRITIFSDSFVKF